MTGGMVIQRRRDWLSALPQAIAAWHGRPTVLGTSDCGLFVWIVVRLGLGVQLSQLPPYGSAREAMRLGRRGGPPAWLAARLDLAADPARLADGDVLALPPDPSVPEGVCGCIGIICGANLWTMQEGAGLAAVPAAGWLARPGVVGAALRDGAALRAGAR